MKRFIILFFSIGVGGLVAGKVEWTNESRRIETEQVALWESKLAEAQAESSHVRPAKLWLGLKNMGYRRQNYDGHSPAVDAIYLRLQQAKLGVRKLNKFRRGKVLASYFLVWLIEI